MPTTDRLVDSSGTSNRADEQATNSLYTTNDNSAYEQASNSLYTTNNDNKHNTETSHAYNHLTRSERQYDTLQNIPDSDSSIITDWNNVYHNIDDGCYSSIDGSPSILNNEAEKKLKDNSSNWLR